jgi:hypothetical protein
MWRQLPRALRYLIGSPDYFFHYFAGRLDAVLGATLGATAERLAELRQELDGAPGFAPRIRNLRQEIVGEPFHLDRDHHFLYALVRLARPAVIFETGVFDGFFSACLLQALDENQRRHGIAGRLVSIDLPAREEMACSTSRYAGRTTLPRGHDPGWVIPSQLRRLWQPHHGDSRELLPRLVAELDRIDLFFHDSLHTDEHMTFEYETVWPKLPLGALLLSHDVHWNRAFPRFARRQRQRPHAAHGFGLIVKSP